MAINFSSSLAAIQADLNQRALGIVWIPVVLLLFWFGWLLLAPLSITKQGSGVLQNGQPEIAIIASVDGRVQSLEVAAGAQVVGGDALVYIQAEAEQQQLVSVQKSLDEQRAALIALQAAQAGENQALRIQQESLAEKQLTLKAQIASVQTRYEQQQKMVTLLQGASSAVSKIELQKEQLQLQELHEHLLITRQQQAQANSDYQQVLEQKKINSSRFEQQNSDQQSRIAALEVELAQAQQAAGHKVLRAPKNARVAEVMPMQAGQWITAGTQLATLIPEGDLQVVAQFNPADAQGYLQAGQQARIQVDSFPWLQFGAVNAEIVKIDEAARDGVIRVVLVLKGKNKLALRSGMTGQVIVDVASATPWQLLMQSLGRQREL